MSDLDVGTMGYLCNVETTLSHDNLVLESVFSYVSDGEEEIAGNEVVYILWSNYELLRHVCCS